VVTKSPRPTGFTKDPSEFSLVISSGCPPSIAGKENKYKGVAESVSFFKMLALGGQKDTLKNVPASNYTKDIYKVFIYI
jgi:hypothetical protein